MSLVTGDGRDEHAHAELQCYTLSHGGPQFIHQHVVDAWAVQHAGVETKPITLAFGLVGLCLHVERGFSGRQVQRAHMALARRRQAWPTFALGAHRGRLTAGDVMAVPAGPARDVMITRWCAAVWEAVPLTHEPVRAMLARHGIV